MVISLNSNHHQLTFVASFSLAVTLGELVNDLYHDSSEADKASWNSERIMHHGALGIILGIIGLIVLVCLKMTWLAMLLLGFGTGMILTDLQDIDRWFTEGLAFN